MQETAEKIYVFVDESGQRSQSKNSSDYFIMAAVLVRASAVEEAYRSLSHLKELTNRRPEHVLHWSKLNDRHRQIVSSKLGQFTHLHYIAAVSCRRELREMSNKALNSTAEVDYCAVPRPQTADEVYLQTFQRLLEPISWFARLHDAQAEITIEHTIRLQNRTLHDFEILAKDDAHCAIDWLHVARPIKMVHKSGEELLQLADAVASGIAQAFNGGRGGVQNRSYVKAMLPRIWKGPNPHYPQVTTYGIVTHPWDETTKGLHPWLLNEAV